MLLAQEAEMSNTTLDTTYVVAGVFGTGVGAGAGQPAAAIRFARRIR